MNLAIINSVYKTGSTGKIASLQNDYFITKGYRSKVYYGRNKVSDDGKSYYFGNRLLLFLSVIHNRVFDTQGPFSVISTRKMLNEFSKEQITAILLHNAHGYYLSQKLLFQWASDNKVPIFWVMHDCWAFTGHCTYYITAGCDKFQTQCYKCPQKLSYPSSLLLDRSFNNYRNKMTLYEPLSGLLSIISVSNWMAEQLSVSILKKFPSYVIHNGVQDFFVEDNSEKEDGRHCLLAVANIWESRKGLDDIIALVPYIDFEIYRLIIVGKISNEYKHKLDSPIEYLSRTDSFEELCLLYKQSMVLLNLTYEDNFPTVNIESLMNGTPIITYNTGGSPEAIDERTGRVVRQGDILGVLSAIEEIRHVNYDISKACRSRYLNNFTNLLMCRKLDQLISNSAPNEREN